jgi:hypothetical protein
VPRKKDATKTSSWKLLKREQYGESPEDQKYGKHINSLNRNGFHHVATHSKESFLK